MIRSARCDVIGKTPTPTQSSVDGVGKISDVLSLLSVSSCEASVIRGWGIKNVVRC